MSFKFFFNLIYSSWFNFVQTNFPSNIGCRAFNILFSIILTLDDTMVVEPIFLKPDLDTGIVRFVEHLKEPFIRLTLVFSNHFLLIPENLTTPIPNVKFSGFSLISWYAAKSLCELKASSVKFFQVSSNVLEAISLFQHNFFKRGFF